MLSYFKHYFRTLFVFAFGSILGAGLTFIFMSYQKEKVDQVYLSRKAEDVMAIQNLEAQVAALTHKVRILNAQVYHVPNDAKSIYVNSQAMASYTSR